jgi:uncharacterized protein (TIGR03546 family)
MFWLQIIKGFIQVLRSGQTPRQIAAGFALGAIVGLMPFFTLQGLFIWLLILIFDVNLSAALLAATLFALTSYVFDPLFHALGFFLLVDSVSLRALWTSLYNAPIAPLTRFNNTVVLGSFVAGVVLLLPVYFGMRHFVLAYRTHLHSKVEQLKIYQIISKSTLVKWYDRIKNVTS